MKTDRTTAILSGEEFARNLSESGLFSEDDVQKLLTVAGDVRNSNGPAVAQRLIEAGTLTAYQADAIVQRRFDELLIGNYEVLDRLGAGGMGTVFKARHRRMKRIVALKVLGREVAKDATFVQRFQREVETVGQLTHPNIVMAYDADEAEVGPFLVMEFVNGRDLAWEVQQKGPLPVAVAVNCTLQAARGLEYAHKQGIVHRDIKPANLLRDAGGLIKVADLGLARLSKGAGTAEGTSLTQAGGVVGTLDFMPPEQALDSTSIDQRADIYSLGGTLYFLLTGRPPYVAGSIMALLLAHRDAPIPSLSEARPSVPAELETLYRRMLAKKPDDRPATMTEVVKALETIKGLASVVRAGASEVSEPAGRSVPAALQDTLRLASSPTEATVAAGDWQRLTTPATSQASPTPSMTGGVPTPSEARRIVDLSVVVVETSRTQAAIIRKYLQEIGISKVQSTGSGKQALEMLEQSRADVLISSLHLSDMLGVELLRSLRADAARAAVGFVLTTSEAEAVDPGIFLPKSRTVLLRKPFDLKTLAQSLADATGRIS
jgi:serine/threonine protein kinase